MDGHRQHWLTGAFADRALEAAYLDDLALRSRLHFRIVVTVALVLWYVVFVFDADIAGTGDNLRVVVGCRLATIPVALFAFVIANGPLRWFTRWWQLSGSLAVGAFVVSLVAMCVLVPDIEAYDTRTTGGGFMLVVVAGYCSAPIRPLYALVPLVPCSIAMSVALLVRTDHGQVAALFIGIGNVLGIASVYMMDRFRRKAFVYSNDLQRERERSDALLYDVMPTAIAERLKRERGAIAEHHDEATVVFADLVGFTQLSERLPADQLVAGLDALFSALDRLAADHGLEKIKTVGDQYMAVAGVPEPREDHADAAVDFAVAMMDVVAGHVWDDGTVLSVRIGIHSGPVVAGVIGRHKLVFDVWGDAVNVASRMESHAPDGRIQLTEATVSRMSDRARVEARGVVSVKGKGEMQTFLVTNSARCPARANGADPRSLGSR